MDCFPEVWSVLAWIAFNCPAIPPEVFDGLPIERYLVEEANRLELDETDRAAVGSWTTVELIRYYRDLDRELADAPKLWTANRFGVPLNIAEDREKFADCFVLHVHFRLAWDSSDYSAWETLAEAKILARCWNNLRTGLSSTHTYPSRRRALARLRDEIGEHNYFQGRMPPCVPVWRFARVD